MPIIRRTSELGGKGQRLEVWDVNSETHTERTVDVINYLDSVKCVTQYFLKWSSRAKTKQTTRDAPIDRPPIDIGRYSLSKDRSVLSKNADCESRSHDVKWWRKIHDTFLCVRQNKLAKMASLVWQYFKCPKRTIKSWYATCVKQKSCSSTSCDGPVSGATHTKS